LHDTEEHRKLLTPVFQKRLSDGRGETLYEIGYDGSPLKSLIVEQGATMKLSETDVMVAYCTLCTVAEALDADCCLIHKTINSGGWMGIVMMRNRSDAVEALEIRVACTSLST
jgi:hypothetical protein